MRILLASYSVGILAVSFAPSLPLVEGVIDGALLCLVLLASLLARWAKLDPMHAANSRLVMLASVFTVGALWHGVSASRQLASQFDEAESGQPLSINGYVSGLAKRRGRGLQFEFQTLSATFSEDAGEQGLSFTGKTLLNFYPKGAFYESATAEEERGTALPFLYPAELRPGTYLSLQVKLGAPRGLANPGVYDREAALFRAGILAVGTIRSELDRCVKPCEQVASPRTGLMTWVHQQRFDLRQRLLARELPLKHPELIFALGLGDGSLLAPEQWNKLRDTGTVHLFVVSGLHIGLASLVFYGFSYGMWNACVLLIPAFGRVLARQVFCSVGAFTGAALFALFAGWGLPVQRALIMLGVVVVGQMFPRRLSPASSLLLAVSGVLSITPLAATSQGFWLSFIAVAALLFTLARVPADASDFEESKFPRMLSRFSLRFVAPQFVIAAVLALPLWLMGNTVSFAAPLINFVAIPFLSVVLLPAVLLTLIDHFLRVTPSVVLLAFTDRLCGLLWSALSLGEGAALSLEPSVALPVSLIIAVALAVLSVLIPLSLRARFVLWGWLGFGLLFNQVILHSDSSAGPETLSSCSQREDSLEVHSIDVGQGLAVLIRTRCHALLYDVGSSFGDGADSGDLIVAPTLKALAVNRLDRVILSHADNDHAGGLAGLSSAIPPQSLMLSGFAENYPALNDAHRGFAVRCQAGLSWRWDGVDFVMLHPPVLPSSHMPAVLTGTSGNAHSCVLRVSRARRSVLLSGDIERAQELVLAAADQNLAADILIAPHHGSATSSSYPLLKRVNPRWIIISAGFNNAFGHPHSDVIARYDLLGIQHVNTANSGLVSLSTAPDVGGGAWFVKTFRQTAPRYWRPR